MDNNALFPALIAQIDSAIGRRPSRLGFRYRNDESFERLCNAAATLYGEFNRDPQRIVLGAAPELRQAIERYETRYRDRIREASHKALEVFLAQLLEEDREGASGYAESDDGGEDWIEAFDERFHLPAAALKDLVNLCHNLSAFEIEEDPNAHQTLEIADGAIDYIEDHLRLGLDEAVRRRRSLKSYLVDASLRAGAVRDWRRVDAYLHQAITAYVLGHNLAAIALARPIAEHLIRSTYMPLLCPEVDVGREDGLASLVRKLQETPAAVWIKTENGTLVIDAANKVLHYNHFDDLKTEGGLAVLAGRILEFVRLLLLRAPRKDQG